MRSSSSCSQAPNRYNGSSDLAGSILRFLARDHAAPESTLALAKAVSLGCGRVRPLAWCSRPRNPKMPPARPLVAETIEETAATPELAGRPAPCFCEQYVRSEEHTSE